MDHGTAVNMGSRELNTAYHGGMSVSSSTMCKVPGGTLDNIFEISVYWMEVLAWAGVRRKGTLRVKSTRPTQPRSEAHKRSFPAVFLIAKSVEVQHVGDTKDSKEHTRLVPCVVYRQGTDRCDAREP